MPRKLFTEQSVTKSTINTAPEQPSARFTRKMSGINVNTEAPASAEMTVKRIRSAAHHIPVEVHSAKENSFHEKVCREGFPEKHVARHAKRMRDDIIAEADLPPRPAPKVHPEKKHVTPVKATPTAEPIVKTPENSARFACRPTSRGNIFA